MGASQRPRLWWRSSSWGAQPALTTASLEAYQSYTRGIELFRRGRRAEALPHFQRAHEIDPDFAWAYVAQALSTGDPKEQEALYTEGCEAFFDLWKNADADIPLLVNARREYSALQ